MCTGFITLVVDDLMINRYNNHHSIFCQQRKLFHRFHIYIFIKMDIRENIRNITALY